jgi:hypothetical protein
VIKSTTYLLRASVQILQLVVLRVPRSFARLLAVIQTRNIEVEINITSNMIFESRLEGVDRWKLKLTNFKHTSSRG